MSLKGDVARLRAALASVVVANNPKLGWREQISIQETPIAFPEGYLKVFPEYAKRLENAQQEALNNLDNQLSIMGQQIEQKRTKFSRSTTGSAPWGVVLIWPAKS